MYTGGQPPPSSWVYASSSGLCVHVAPLQDGIKVEWEEQLPLEDYAIRIPMWLAHKTPDILDHFIKSGRVARMQKVLDCAWRLHW